MAAKNRAESPAKGIAWRTVEGMLSAYRRASSLFDSQEQEFLLRKAGMSSFSPYLMTADKVPSRARWFATKASFVAGGNLGFWLQTTWPSLGDDGYQKGLGIAYKVCSALMYVHRVSCVHRNICLEAIFMSDTGIPKLGGLGHVAETLRNGVEASTFNVTSDCRAPEVVLGCDKCAQAADMFAFGTVFYSLMTGKTLIAEYFDNNQQVYKSDLKGNKSKYQTMLKSLEHEPKLMGHTEVVELLCALLAFESSDRPGAQNVVENAVFKDVQPQVEQEKQSLIAMAESKDEQARRLQLAKDEAAIILEIIRADATATALNEPDDNALAKEVAAIDEPEPGCDDKCHDDVKRGWGVGTDREPDDKVESIAERQEGSDRPKQQSADKSVDGDKPLEVAAAMAVTPNVKDFEKVKLLGKGGYGQVFLVRHTATRKLSAMKVMGRSQEAMFNKEQHLLEQCKSQFIVGFDHPLRDDSTMALVMEYMQGGDLENRLLKLNQGQFLSEHESRVHFAQVLLAVEHVHELGYVHRDIKPSNVLMAGDGRLKLADFGSNAQLDDNGLVKGQIDIPVGTAQYMSPEVTQFRSSYGRYGKSCDIWSLGIMLHEMLTEDVPFDHESRIQLYKLINECQLNPQALAHLSESAQDLIKRLLTVDPTQRLGCGGNGIADIKAHAWFKGHIDWDAPDSIMPVYVPPKDEDASTVEEPSAQTACDVKAERHQSSDVSEPQQDDGVDQEPVIGLAQQEVQPCQVEHMSQSTVPRSPLSQRSASGATSLTSTPIKMQPELIECRSMSEHEDEHLELEADKLKGLHVVKGEDPVETDGQQEKPFASLPVSCDGAEAISDIEPETDDDDLDTDVNGDQHAARSAASKLQDEPEEAEPTSTEIDGSTHGSESDCDTDNNSDCSHHGLDTTALTDVSFDSVGESQAFDHDEQVVSDIELELEDDNIDTGDKNKEDEESDAAFSMLQHGEDVTQQTVKPDVEKSHASPIKGDLDLDDSLSALLNFTFSTQEKLGNEEPLKDCSGDTTLIVHEDKFDLDDSDKENAVASLQDCIADEAAELQQTSITTDGVTHQASGLRTNNLHLEPKQYRRKLPRNCHSEAKRLTPQQLEVEKAKFNMRRNRKRAGLTVWNKQHEEPKTSLSAVQRQAPTDTTMQDSQAKKVSFGKRQQDQQAAVDIGQAASACQPSFHHQALILNAETKHQSPAEEEPVIEEPVIRTRFGSQVFQVEKDGKRVKKAKSCYATPSAIFFFRRANQQFDNESLIEAKVMFKVDTERITSFQESDDGALKIVRGKRKSKKPRDRHGQSRGPEPAQSNSVLGRLGSSMKAGVNIVWASKKTKTITFVPEPGTRQTLIYTILASVGQDAAKTWHPDMLEAVKRNDQQQAALVSALESHA